MKSNTLLSLLLIQLALSTKAFKTIDLCLEKTPRNGRHNWYPNKYQMRDLMTEAAKANENRLLQEEDFYNYFILTKMSQILQKGQILLKEATLEAKPQFLVQWISLQVFIDLKNNQPRFTSFENS